MPTRNVRTGWTQPVIRAKRVAAAIPLVENGRGRALVAGGGDANAVAQFDSLRIDVLVTIRCGPP